MQDIKKNEPYLATMAHEVFVAIINSDLSFFWLLAKARYPSLCYNFVQSWRQEKRMYSWNVNVNISGGNFNPVFFPTNNTHTTSSTLYLFIITVFPPSYKKFELFSFSSFFNFLNFNHTNLIVLLFSFLFLTIFVVCFHFLFSAFTFYSLLSLFIFLSHFSCFEFKIFNCRFFFSSFFLLRFFLSSLQLEFLSAPLSF